MYQSCGLTSFSSHGCPSRDRLLPLFLLLGWLPEEAPAAAAYIYMSLAMASGELCPGQVELQLIRQP